MKVILYKSLSILLIFKASFFLSNLDSLKILLTKADQTKKAQFYSELCFGYVYINADSALKYGKTGLDFSRKAGDKYYEAYILSSIGNLHYEAGKYASALDNYIQSEKLFNEINDSRGKIIITLNIGKVYQQQGLTDKALFQYDNCAKLCEIYHDKEYLANSYVSIGSLYYSKNEKLHALDYFTKSLDINKEINNVPRIMEGLNNVAVINQELGNYGLALKNFNIFLDYSRKMNDKKSIVASMHNIGLVYKDEKQYSHAINYIDSGISIAVQIKDFDDLREMYSTLSEIYKEQKNIQKAFDCFQLSASYKDSLLYQTRDKQFIEMSTKYDTEKKEAENLLLNQQIELKNVESSRQQIAIIAIGIILIIVGIVTFVLIKQNRLKQRINQQLAEKNHIIEEQHKDITDSIQYSKRIQEAIMPTMHLWNEIIPDSFVLYKPKDVLSGDFYWLEKTKETIYFAACDCTGHGVPGAMVSVICSTALNRAVKEFGIKDTGQILDKVRELVLETFEKSEGKVQDGMDISICGLNTKTLELKWSGANNPLWYLNNGEAKEITATKQPIGKVDNPKPFTQHIVQLAKNDIIYVFTDGYADQFGGPKGKKFKYKQLKELLLNNAAKKMSEQHNILLNAFENWRGNLEQVDDVCVIGVRV